MIELRGVLARALGLRGITVEQIANSPDGLSRFVRSMPSTEVSMTIKTAWHRNSHKKWTANDVYDIDALAVAVPCSDIVVTEKACHHVLTTAGLDRRMRTVLLRRLADLPDAIEGWKAP